MQLEETKMPNSSHLLTFSDQCTRMIASCLQLKIWRENKHPGSSVVGLVPSFKVIKPLQFTATTWQLRLAP